MRRTSVVEPILVAIFGPPSDVIELRCPAVGYWTGSAAQGSLIKPNFDLGWIETLGVMQRVVAPPGAVGIVKAHADWADAPQSLGYGDTLVRLDPDAVEHATDAHPADAGPSDGLAFRSPLAGRFYLRPGPDQPPFVTPGDTVTRGQTVALLEVMKTFNRVTYGGDHLPTTARIQQIVPTHESDLEQGDVILRLDPQG